MFSRFEIEIHCPPSVKDTALNDALVKVVDALPATVGQPLLSGTILPNPGQSPTVIFEVQVSPALPVTAVQTALATLLRQAVANGSLDAFGVQGIGPVRHVPHPQ